MNEGAVSSSRLRGNGQRTAIAIALFVVLWQVVGFVGERLLHVHGISPIYPDAALDAIFLLVIGWRFWPVIPLCAIVQWGLNDHLQLFLLWPALVVQTIVGLGFGLAVYYIVDVLGVPIPPRNLRDVVLLCGIIGIGAPLLIGIAASSAIVALGGLSVDDVPLEFSRFVLGDATAVMVLAPTALVFMRWRALEPPAEHVPPARSELVATLLATVLLVAASRILAAFINETVLDLSFVPIAWLAIRFGMRGAAIGVAIAYAGSIVAVVALHQSMVVAVQSEALLFASALMGWLLAGLTDERWELLAKLSRRAYVDELTGLPNRERLIQWVAHHQDSPVILVIMDVDDMRMLNQGVGRVAADRVLQEMAMRMRVTFPSSHFVARVSADEFAVAVEDDRSPHAIMAELRSFFDAPFDAEGSRIYISIAMGAIRMARAGSPEELLRKADIALDRAKSSPSRAVVYTPEMKVGDAPSFVGELHRAVERRELVPFFQPIFRYDPETQRWNVVGAEALLRWMHPERGILSPASFIDLLERLTIGDRVGWDVMDYSLRQAAQWRRIIPEFRVWVNLFARQTLSRDCDRHIAEALARAGVPASALVVEINESVVASDERDVAMVVSRLRELGVMSAIDDFGTGESSLGRVRDVPAAVLKIDRSFVNTSEVDAKAKTVAAAVVRLANELNMTALAEGVENAMQLEVMLEMGCHLVQGYALGHPLPADLFARTFLEEERALSS